MALVIDTNDSQLISSKKVRVVRITPKEVGEKEKIITHQLDIGFEIIDRDTWKKMTDRSADLARKYIKSKEDKDYQMPDEELEEFLIPTYMIAEPYIVSINPMVDQNNQPIQLTDAIKSSLLKEPWLQADIGDAFLAAQRSLTVADIRKERAKNS